MDSDEEEMAAMRGSNRYGGGRQPAPGAASSSGSTSNAATAKPKTDDSDDERAGSSTRQRQRGPQPPSRRADDSDEDMKSMMSMSVEEPDEEVTAMRGFLPVSFGGRKQGVMSGGADVKTLQAAQRQDKAVAQKKKGVQFGPRIMDAAAMAGQASRTAAATARAAQEAEERARREEAMEEDSKKGQPEEEEAVYGFDAPPPAGSEHEVVPVTHEAVIPCFDRAVTAIGLDPKGSRMVSGGVDCTCKYYDFNGMSEAKENFRSLEPIEHHMVQAISFSTTGGCVLIVTSDSHARIFDRDGSAKPVQGTVKGDMYVRAMEHTNGHTQMLTDGMWHPQSPDNFITSSLDGTIRIWDMRAKPVGMDQVLPSIHVLKTLDRRNVCLGGASGRNGGLYPTCCAYSPTASMIAGGCSDGSIQVFFEKARYSKPDKIVRTAHSGPLTCVAFLGNGVGGNKLISRAQDSTMKLWDCRVLSDAKGPLKAWTDLPAGHERQGVCSSPDGKYIVTGTSLEKGAKGNATLRVYDADDYSLVKVLDFGQRSVIKVVWQKDINQILVGTSAGEVVMLYSPFSSKKGALHFVGRHRRAKAAHEIEDSGFGPIFSMVDGKDIHKFHTTVLHNNADLGSLRRQKARAEQKTTVPIKPPEPQGKTATTSGTKLVSKIILEMEGKSKVASEDSQKVLLKYATGGGKEKDIYMGAYAENQPVNILDYSVDENEGDQKMELAMGGDFCRKCGMKMCRCVDYSKWGDSQGSDPLKRLKVATPSNTRDDPNAPKRPRIALPPPGATGRK